MITTCGGLLGTKVLCAAAGFHFMSISESNSPSNNLSSSENSYLNTQFSRLVIKTFFFQFDVINFVANGSISYPRCFEGKPFQ